MSTLFSHLRRKPIGLLSLLLQIPLLTLAAPSGHSIAVRLAVEEPRLIGALYFTTNDPSGNAIVAGQVQSNGSVIFSNTTIYPTQGNGSHVKSTDPHSPDALRSQGAIAVSKSAQVLATVNAGSNTVSLFNISDPSAPWNISLINQPVGSFGGFPLSITFNKMGNLAYVLNGGATNGVTCYNVSKESGLIPIAGSDRKISNVSQTDPPTTAKGMPNQLVLTEDETKLFVSVSGVSEGDPGFITGWLIDADGLLSDVIPPMYPAAPGYSPSSFAEVPKTNALIVTDHTFGLEVFNLTAASDPNSCGPAIPGAMANTNVSRLSFSERTGNFHLIDSKNRDVIEITVNYTLNTTVMNSSRLCKSCTPLDSNIADLNGTEYLYVLDAKNTAVIAVQLLNPGNATVIGSYNASGLPTNSGNIQGLASFISQSS